MLVSDLLHSCANDFVAEAAVRSIGGTFAVRLKTEADESGVTVGGLAAHLVRDFARRASERDWRDLAVVVRGQDHPVLAGLQFVAERRGAGPRGDGTLPGFHFAQAKMSAAAA